MGLLGIYREISAKTKLVTQENTQMLKVHIRIKNTKFLGRTQKIFLKILHNTCGISKYLWYFVTADVGHVLSGLDVFDAGMIVCMAMLVGKHENQNSHHVDYFDVSYIMYDCSVNKTVIFQIVNEIVYQLWNLGFGLPKC